MLHRLTRREPGGSARLGKKLVTDYFKIGQNPLKTVGQLFATNLFSFQRDQRISKRTRITELGLKIPRSARDCAVRFPPSAPFFSYGYKSLALPISIALGDAW